MASYAVRKIPLDTAFSRMEIQPPGQLVPSVAIVKLDAGSSGNMELHIGSDGDGIPLFLMGQEFPVTPPENNGVYLTNLVAQPGATIVILIGYAVNVVTQRAQ